MVRIRQLEVWLVKSVHWKSYRVAFPSVPISNCHVAKVPAVDRRVVVPGFDRRIVNALRSDVSIDETLKSRVVGR
jgi:hypothetical protein